jgi:hypothetical protein
LLEGLDESIRLDMAKSSSSEPAYKSPAPQAIDFHANSGYRSPETIARYILRALPSEFVPGTVRFEIALHGGNSVAERLMKA